MLPFSQLTPSGAHRLQEFLQKALWSTEPEEHLGDVRGWVITWPWKATILIEQLYRRYIIYKWDSCGVIGLSAGSRRDTRYPQPFLLHVGNPEKE